MPVRILIADDDRAIRESVARALGLEGYEVVTVSDGVQALARAGAPDDAGALIGTGVPTLPPTTADAEPVDLLLLDVMMPTLDGLAVCRRLRSRGDRRPILMLTARTEISDRVSGLDAGADDYLPKPFALDELLARVRALLRRSAPEESEPELQVADLRVDEAARRAWRGDRELELTKTEFDLLELLARNAEIVLEHSTIYDRIWGYDFGPESKALAVYIGYLRRKTEQDGEPRLVQTVRGVGYTLRDV